MIHLRVGGRAAFRGGGKMPPLPTPKTTLPLGKTKVSLFTRCPHFRGVIKRCPYFGEGVLTDGFHFSEANLNLLLWIWVLKETHLTSSMLDQSRKRAKTTGWSWISSAGTKTAKRIKKRPNTYKNFKTVKTRSLASSLGSFPTLDIMGMDLGMRQVDECLCAMNGFSADLQNDGENSALNETSGSVYDLQQHHQLAKYHHRGHLLICTRDTV